MILTTVNSNILNFKLFNKTFKMTRRKINDNAGFQKILAESKNIIALTGAGISAESGIPVFRGAGGLWRQYQATSLATPEAFRANPALVWRFYSYRRNIAFNAQPNDAHKALVEYEKRCEQEGKNFTIITQNVDGLHRKAGSKNIIELHGVLHKVICTNKSCRKIEDNFDDPICEALSEIDDPLSLSELEPISKDKLPQCKHCNHLLRPYIVWFGENLDPKIMDQSRKLVEACDLCLIIGTSSVVYPAAMFAPHVAERGKPVAEFNLNPEPANDSFSFHFPGKCGTTLPKALGITL